MTQYDEIFHDWLSQQDADGITRFKRFTGYLTDTEKDLAYHLMQIAFVAGYVRGNGLIGGGANAYTTNP